MDILINVSKQRLKLATNLKKYVSGSQEFVRFVFGLNSYWRDLLTFAQFAQNGNTYNRYLDDENAVYLPSEIVAGECTLTLFGSGNNVIATTNYLTLTIDENILVSDASSTDISESLYEQLVDMVRSVSNGTAVVDTTSKMTDKNKIYVYIGSETGMTNGNWYYWNGTIWTSGGVWNAVAVETDKTLSVEDKAADGKAAGSLVEVGSIQPTSSANKIWIDPTDEEIEIPEMSDLNAVDAKVDDLKRDISDTKQTFYVPPELTWQIGKGITDQGVITDNQYTAITNIITCQSGDVIIINTPEKDTNNKWFIKYIAYYSTTYSLNDTFVERVGDISVGVKRIVPNNVTGFRVFFGRTAGSGVAFSENDVSYWQMEYFFKYPTNSVQSIGMLPNNTDFNKINDNVVSNLNGGYTYINTPENILAGIFVCVKNMYQSISNYFKGNATEYARYWNGTSWTSWAQTNVTSNDVTNTISNRIKNLDGRVKVFKSGLSTLYIRSSYDNTLDIVQCVACPLQNYNYTFNFVNVFLIPKGTSDSNTISACTDATLVKRQIDDVPSLWIRGTNGANIAIGGNHASTLFTKCNCTHSLTFSNIGEVWKDENNNEYTIVQVFDDYLITGSLGADGWMVVRNPSTLTKNGVTIYIGSSESYQLYPCAINKKWTVQNEQNADVMNGGSGECIIISEDYDLVNQNKVLLHLQNNVGNNDNESSYSNNVPLTYTYGHFRSKYIFVEGGTTSCFIDFVSRENFVINKNFGILDAYFPNTINYGYVPDSTNVLTPTILSSDVYVEFGDTVPHRFFVLGANGSGYFTNFFVGISDCAPEERAELEYAGWYRSNANKFYGFLSENKQMTNGDVMSWGYARGAVHGYVNNKPILCYYKSGDNWIITIDCITGYSGYVPLPDFLIGYNFKELKKSSGMSVIGSCIGSSGIKVSANAGSYCELMTI